LHKNDEKRILRALEVYRETGRTISQHNEETKDAPLRYEPVYLGFAYAERERMKQTIDLRVDKMMAEGLLEEVEALLQSGIPASATALQAIGYKECLAVFSGEKSAQEASDEVKLRSRQYAKRQLTWLRRNKDIHWFFWSDSRDFEAALAFSTKILADHAVS
ncbi:MAG: tRNA (adenosine(37)-N6)-dimethylallyltransferase MiaA, partial [Oscillospiraceae bacterium]|nr:tRNA (adenosine(37)-N6)-dimethylallyltransferase MiaA [Oscillospiraceae bacterium]